MSKNWLLATTVTELKEKKALFTEINELEIALFWIDDKAYAMNNFCPHRGGPLYRGDIEEDLTVRCPLHGWLFHLDSGKCINIPDAKVNTFPTQIKDGNVYIDWQS